MRTGEYRRRDPQLRWAADMSPRAKRCVACVIALSYLAGLITGIILMVSAFQA